MNGNTLLLINIEVKWSAFLSVPHLIVPREPLQIWAKLHEKTRPKNLASSECWYCSSLLRIASLFIASHKSDTVLVISVIKLHVICNSLHPRILRGTPPRRSFSLYLTAQSESSTPPCVISII